MTLAVVLSGISTLVAAIAMTAALLARSRQTAQAIDAQRAKLDQDWRAGQGRSVPTATMVPPYRAAAG